MLVNTDLITPRQPPLAQTAHLRYLVLVQSGSGLDKGFIGTRVGGETFYD